MVRGARSGTRSVVFGGFGILKWAQRRLPILTRVNEADAAFELENPDIIVTLRPASAGADAPAFVRIRSV